MFWQYCLDSRYENEKQEYMEKIRRKDNEDGKTIIYVLECSKFRKYISFREPIYNDYYSKYFKP